MPRIRRFQMLSQSLYLIPVAGTLARLYEVERREGEASGHSIAAAMAAAETCPIGALEHTAVRAWRMSN